MMTEPQPDFAWGPLIGFLLIAQPWLSLICPPLFGLWLVLVFLFLFLMPALGRLHDVAEERQGPGKSRDHFIRLF
jgi:hypothetical protein